MTRFHYTKVFVVYMQNGPLLQLSRLFLYELWTMVFCWMNIYTKIQQVALLLKKKDLIECSSN